MYRLGSVSQLLLRAASTAAKQHLAAVSCTCSAEAPLQVANGAQLLKSVTAQKCNIHTSLRTFAADSTPVTPAEKDVTKEPDLSHLLDKDEWDELWPFEQRFGTVEDPIVVPSTVPERIIGVTDPEDDTLVIWGIIREDEPPKQLVENGEFFVLRRVERVPRVGDFVKKG